MALILERRLHNYNAYRGSTPRSNSNLCEDAASQMHPGFRRGTIKLAPGDHGNFEIFIQSTSNNRKLLAGTKCVYWRGYA